MTSSHLNDLVAELTSGEMRSPWQYAKRFVGSTHHEDHVAFWEGISGLQTGSSYHLPDLQRIALETYGGNVGRLLSPYASFWASDPLWSAPANGAAVSSWRNDGTLGTAATQATPASQPTFRSSVAVLNNRPAVDFNGTSSRLEIVSGVNLPQPYSAVWIGSYDQGGPRAHLGTNSGGAAYYFGIHSTGTLFWAAPSGAARTGGTYAAGVPYMQTTYANGASTAINLNNVNLAMGGGTGGTGALNQLSLGSGRTAPSTYQWFQDGPTAQLLVVAGDVRAHAHWATFWRWADWFYSIT